VDKTKHYAEDTIEISAKKKLRYSAYYRCIVAWFFVGDVSNSSLCIGGYSALPSANLLSLGIMQADLPSALAKSQFCLCSLRIGVSIVVELVSEQYV
jgi:hypothetical protein